MGRQQLTTANIAIGSIAACADLRRWLLHSDRNARFGFYRRLQLVSSGGSRGCT